MIKNFAQILFILSLIVLFFLGYFLLGDQLPTGYTVVSPTKEGLSLASLLVVSFILWLIIEKE